MKTEQRSLDDLGGAVVTGGTSGIGLAIVERLTREGYQVVALSRAPREDFEALARWAEAAGAHVPRFVAADVVDAAQLVNARDEVAAILGNRVRVVVAATKDVRLLAAGKTAWPRFTIQEVGNYPTLDAPTPSGPTILAAGSGTTYDLTFETPRLSDGGRSRIILAGTYVEPTLGEWILRMQVQDEAGLFYELTTPVSVTATP